MAKYELISLKEIKTILRHNVTYAKTLNLLGVQNIRITMKLKNNEK